jgi:hypothetical protein
VKESLSAKREFSPVKRDAPTRHLDQIYECHADIGDFRASATVGLMQGRVFAFTGEVYPVG